MLASTPTLLAGSIGREYGEVSQLVSVGRRQEALRSAEAAFGASNRLTQALQKSLDGTYPVRQSSKELYCESALPPGQEYCKHFMPLSCTAHLLDHVTDVTDVRLLDWRYAIICEALLGLLTCSLAVVHANTFRCRQ